MKVQEWHQRREWRAWGQEKRERGFCDKCLRSPLTCYCAKIQRFDPKITFAILIHGREAQKRIATGRLAHLSLENSYLIQGANYSANARVNALVADPANHCVVLYPGEGSVDMSALPAAERAALFPREKNLVIFVIDGTWATAQKTMKESGNLRGLPRVCFNPHRPSNFRVRKQPRENYLSTVEAIHETIELAGPGRGFASESREHDNLLTLFDQMVDQQIALASQPKLYCLWKPKKS